MHGLKLAVMGDGRKAIVIRTSDRISFKKCRRSWSWSSHLKGNLGPSYLASPLWFGSAIHYALEDFHGYKHFETASDAFKAYCIATSKQHLRDLPQDAEALYKLGDAMMNYYTNDWLSERKIDETYWEADPVTGEMVPQVEVNFEIEIPITDGQNPLLAAYAKAQGADCILYRGTIDRVGIDEHGRLWCIAKDTWVGSTKGICLIQDHPDAKFMGVKETVVVCTDSSYKVECTPDHEIMTANRGWVMAQDLNMGDELVLNDYASHYEETDSDYWWTVGYWYGDGSLRNHGKGSIDFSTGHDKEELAEYLNQFFRTRNEEVRYAANKQTTGYSYVTNQAFFAEDLRALFSTPWNQGKTKYKKSAYIPLDKIGNMAAFLRGLFDADGTVGKRRDGFSTISLANKSAETIEQIHQTLAFFGIKASVTHLTRDQYKWSNLQITDGESVRKFKDVVGFRLRRKQEAISITPTTRYIGPRVCAILPGREVGVYDLINQPNKQFSAGGLVVHNCIEYKTAKVAEQLHYQTDSQVTTYVWAMRHIYNKPVAGVVYMQFVKNEPKAPRFLASGKISTATNQSTSSILYKRALIGMYGSVLNAPEENRKYLTDMMIKEDADKDRYILREYIYRNEHMTQAEAQKILLEAEDMLNPDLPLYPNPTRDCSRMCSFLGACVSFDDGGDWENNLQLNFSSRDQAADRLWRRRLPNTVQMLALRDRGTPDLEDMQIRLQSLDPGEQSAIEAGEASIDFTFQM